MTTRDFWLIAYGAMWAGGLDRIWPVERVPLLGLLELACALFIAISLARRPQETPLARPNAVNPEATHDDHDD